METKIEWTEKAESNLNNILDFIALDSPTYAKRFVKSLIEATQTQLVKFPHSGRLVPEFENTPINHLKELIFKGYRVIYIFKERSDKIIIIAVINGRQDVYKNIKPDWLL